MSGSQHKVIQSPNQGHIPSNCLSLNVDLDFEKTLSLNRMIFCFAMNLSLTHMYRVMYSGTNNVYGNFYQTKQSSSLENNFQD